MQLTTVLLIDRDVEYASLLTMYLQREQFAVTLAHDGASGISYALSGHYAIVVLDIVMTDIASIEVLRRIRLQSSTPILALSAKGNRADRIRGLELGADDCVPKHCTPRELIARLRAILRRARPLELAEPSYKSLTVGALAMWPERRHAELLGKSLQLTSTEFSLLEILALNVGHPVSKSELSQHGLGRPMEKFDRSVDMHLSSIRHKLGALSDGRSRIQTVFRRGYQLIKD